VFLGLLKDFSKYMANLANFPADIIKGLLFTLNRKAENGSSFK